MDRAPSSDSTGVVGVWVCGCVGVWGCGGVGVWGCGGVGVWGGLCLCLCLCLCVCWGLRESVCVSVFLCGCVSVCLCLCLCVCVFVFGCLFVCVCVSVCLCICAFVCLCERLSLPLSVQSGTFHAVLSLHVSCPLKIVTNCVRVPLEISAIWRCVEFQNSRSQGARQLLEIRLVPRPVRISIDAKFFVRPKLFPKQGRQCQNCHLTLWRPQDLGGGHGISPVFPAMPVGL